MTYNLTSLESANNLYDVVLFANNTTGEVLGIGLIVAIFFIAAFSLSYRGWRIVDSVGASAFLCLTISLALTSIKLIPGLVSMLFLILAALSAFYIYMFD